MDRIAKDQRIFLVLVSRKHIDYFLGVCKPLVHKNVISIFHWTKWRRFDVKKTLPPRPQTIVRRWKKYNLDRRYFHDVDTTLTSWNQPWFNVQTTTIYWRQLKVCKITLVKRQSFIDKLTLQNQLWFNVKITLIDRRWNNVCKTTLIWHQYHVIDVATFLRPKYNVKTTSFVRWLTLSNARQFDLSMWWTPCTKGLNIFKICYILPDPWPYNP